ncbi:MAG: BPTI/Kunitz domain-containing protein [Planctomycetes bacterium]|nr:BPTI/Kunitz domain-containing protein [Planctomycetota bacterium]
MTVLPDGTITPNDPVSLEILITTRGAPAHLTQATEVVVAANDISVDIFVNSGPATVLDSLLETVELGTFEPGVYVYTIVLHPPFEYDWATLTVTGSFRVTCAPGPLCDESDVCLLSPDPGPCDGVCPRVFYNASTEECESFVYGCCGGNANNFLTPEECQAACGSPIPAVSTWGLLVTMFLFLIAGTVAIQTRTISRARATQKNPAALPTKCQSGIELYEETGMLSSRRTN